RAYYATGDVRTPVWMGLISIVINVIFSFILLGPLAHGGLALANSLAAIANTILLFFFLQRKFPDLGGQRFFTGCAKMLTASIVMGAVVWGLYKILLGFVPAGTFGLTLNVFITIIVGAMVYLLLCAVLKIEEFVLLMSFFQRKLKKLDKSTNN
ncbi:MAG: lipid II flippase MurJ, partial [Clostridia bacterium]|nr:lipid II flippase MurJ [Clostridia bacterium]